MTLTMLVLAAVSCACAVTAAPARADRQLISKTALKTTYCALCSPPSAMEQENPVPPPEGELEDPCGLAVDPGGAEIFVSDYYHRAVDLFRFKEGEYQFTSQISLPGGPFSGAAVNDLDSVCGLAIDSAGDLYGDEFHRRVLSLSPSEFIIDEGESTGVAVDSAGDVFVDDRTYIAEYQAPVQAGDPPFRLIGQGSLASGYGLAVSPNGTRIYVADAAVHALKIYEPAHSPTTPQATIKGNFTSLADSALAIDPTNEHVLLLINRQPGYEHPEAVLDEFTSAGSLLDQITGPPGNPIIDGEPSGLALDGAGDLFVTDGNSELANVFEFGPYSESLPATARGAEPDFSPNYDTPIVQTATASAATIPTVQALGARGGRPQKTRDHRRGDHRRSRGSSHRHGGERRGRRHRRRSREIKR